MQAVPVEVSLEILRGVHLRRATLLATCSDAQWERTAHHPGLGRDVRLDVLTAQYDWHGRHHLAHLRVVAGETNFG